MVYANNLAPVTRLKFICTGKMSKTKKETFTDEQSRRLYMGLESFWKLNGKSGDKKWAEILNSSGVRPFIIKL